MANLQLPGMDTLALELDSLRRKVREGSLDEPQGLFILDSPGPQALGKQLALTYAQQHASSQTILYAEVPEPRARHSPTYFASNLLEQFGDPPVQKREDLSRKNHRLFHLVRERHIELLILTEVHRLTTAGGTKLLLNEFDWLKYIVKEIEKIVLLLVGEETVLQPLLSSNALFARLLYPFDLPDTTKLY